jgi:hypothetical protein
MRVETPEIDSVRLSLQELVGVSAYSMHGVEVRIVSNSKYDNP